MCFLPPAEAAGFVDVAMVWTYGVFEESSVCVDAVTPGLLHFAPMLANHTECSAKKSPENWFGSCRRRMQGFVGLFEHAIELHIALHSFETSQFCRYLTTLVARTTD